MTVLSHALHEWLFGTTRNQQAAVQFAPRLSTSLPSRPLNVAVLGASGAVGQELLLLLEERQFPVAELKLLASARSAGQTQRWNGRTLTVEEVTADAFAGVDLVLASAGGSVSRQWREAITAAGAVMVDNSSAFRMEDGVPLVVPEEK